MLLSFIHNLILFLVLIFLAIYLLAFSFKYRKINKYGFNSTILTAIILIVLGSSILIFDGLLPYPLNAAINIWLGIIFGVQGIYFIIIKFKYKEKINKTNIDETTYDGGELKLKSEYLRKSFHTFILLVAICYFFLAFLINDFVFQLYSSDPELYYSIWRTLDYPLQPKNTEQIKIALIWTFMFFIAAIILFIIPDIFRIYNRKYSIFSGVYKKVIRMKELYAVGPQIYLVLACTFIFLFAVFGLISPIVAVAGMMIAAFGDAAAAIIGRKYGKHKFNTFFQKDEQKSYEGTIAGFTVSFLVAVIFVGPFIAILGALTFSIIDYLNPKIADNVLNPIFCTFVMMIPFWFIL
ncbi:MAG: hypothetical protein ACTSQJ_09940 [Promethearchaeota archaeon]